MNERNVEALNNAIGSIMLANRDWRERMGSPLPSGGTRWFASQLAARGVLVPSAVTDEEWHRVVGGDEGKCLAELECIAAGGPPSRAPFRSI